MYNAGGHPIHDHFIVKSLRLTAPGGVVAVVTSAGTLDKSNPAARREMHSHGDLVGAVRLPSGAMARVAGTDVVTDVLILRRRRDGEAPDEFTGRWEKSVEVATNSGPVTLNEWYAAHPEMILGELESGRGLYRSDEMRVRPDGRDLETALAAAVDTIVAEARDRGLTLDARPGEERAAEQAATTVLVERDRDPKPGTITTTPTGGFARYTIDRGWVDHDVRASQAGELRELLALRDEVLALVDSQAAGGDRAEVQARRTNLNRLYDAYVQRHGPVNRFKLTQPRRDGAVPQKRRPPFGGLRKHDPDFAVIAALELFDEETGEVRKAPIFTVDVIRPREPARAAESPADAVAITSDETGRVDIDRVAALLGVEAAEAWEDVQAQGLAFIDPATGQVEPAARYLSGNVQEKLELARRYAADKDGDQWKVNIAALERVQPPDLQPGEISVKPGVTWIPAADYRDFLAEVFGATTDQVCIDYQPELGKWVIEVPRWQWHSPAMTATWGTDRRDAVALLEASMNNTQSTSASPKKRAAGGT